MNKVRICCISDTHKMHRQITLPKADILIHAGDLTRRGSIADIANFSDWLEQQDFEEKIIIAGNHDWLFQNNPPLARDILRAGDACDYLEDETVERLGIKFHGSPWQPEFCDWAFNIPRGTGLLKEKWDMIPDDTDVLITHGPARFHLDKVATIYPDHKEVSYHQGCAELADRFLEMQLNRKPILHVFGHIHEGYGWQPGGRVDETCYVNASTCTLSYQPINKPIIVDLQSTNDGWRVTHVGDTE